MKITSYKTSTRYDDDFGGNHIDRERERERRATAGLFVDFSRFLCAKCKTHAPRLGSTMIGKRRICGECKVARQVAI